MQAPVRTWRPAPHFGDSVPPAVRRLRGCIRNLLGPAIIQRSISNKVDKEGLAFRKIQSGLLRNAKIRGSVKRSPGEIVNW